MTDLGLLQEKLPAIKQWIAATLEEHSQQVATVSSLPFTRLPKCFSAHTLHHAKVAVVPQLPYPPLHQFELGELARDNPNEFTGITYLDTFFVLPTHRDKEWLYVHELVHVIQWQVLGADRFLLEYAVGIDEHPDNYYSRPLERMARDHDQRFQRGETYDVESAVRGELSTWLSSFEIR